MFDYAPAPESRDLVKFQESYGHFIGGKFTKPSNTYGTINPATEETLAQISHGTAKDVDAKLVGYRAWEGGSVAVREIGYASVLH